MKYIRKFKTTQEADAYLGSYDLRYPYVILINGIESVYSMGAGIVDNPVMRDYYNLPLTIRALEDNTVISFSAEKDIQYSLDHGITWIKYIDQNISLSKNEEVQFMGNNPRGFNEVEIDIDDPDSVPTYISDQRIHSISGSYEAFGNILSLVFGLRFRYKENRVICKGGLSRLFYQDTRIKSAENLILPTQVPIGALYYSMFEGCVNLEKLPKYLYTDWNTDNTELLKIYGYFCANCKVSIYPPMKYIDRYFFYKNNFNSNPIILPDSVKEVYRSSVREVTNITGDLILRDPLKNIGYASFYSMDSLWAGKIITPSKVEFIGLSAFCNNFIQRGTTFELPYIKKLEQEVWADSLNTEEIKLGKYLETLGDGDMRTTYNDIFPTYLDKVTIDPDNPNFKSINNVVYSMDGKDFYGGADGYISVTYPTYEIPEGTENIVSGAFRNVGSIGDSYPIGGESLTYEQAWERGYTIRPPFNYIIKHVIFPSTTKYIGDRVLQYSKTVEIVTVKAITPPELFTTTFWSSRPKDVAVIYVPAESVSNYKNATNWRSYASIIKPIPEDEIPR